MLFEETRLACTDIILLVLLIFIGNYAWNLQVLRCLSYSLVPDFQAYIYDERYFRHGIETVNFYTIFG